MPCAGLHVEEVPAEFYESYGEADPHEDQKKASHLYRDIWEESGTKFLLNLFRNFITLMLLLPSAIVPVIFLITREGVANLLVPMIVAQVICIGLATEAFYRIKRLADLRARVHAFMIVTEERVLTAGLNSNTLALAPIRRGWSESGED